MVSILRVNETKVTLRNDFIDNNFALESEKESKRKRIKKRGRSFFLDYQRILDFAVNP